jgi:2-deoxy-D-gluconate 3-dehydrogenase
MSNAAADLRTAITGRRRGPASPGSERSPIRTHVSSVSEGRLLLRGALGARLLQPRLFVADSTDPMKPRSLPLAEHVALVTGASTGIGAAIATALAEAGADVACHGNSHSPDATCEQVRKLGRRTVSLQGDLARRPTAAALVRETIEAFGRIDVLVNNAGLIRRSPAASVSEADWDTVLEVNLSSVFRLAQSAGAAMLERRRGKIVNIASLLSFQGGVHVAAYAASKGGVAQLTKALSNEWASKGVNVNAIAPGYVRTENTRALQDDPTRSRQILERIPAGRWGEPADIAGAAVFLCSRASDYVHGHVLVVDGGWMGR